MMSFPTIFGNSSKFGSLKILLAEKDHWEDGETDRTTDTVENIAFIDGVNDFVQKSVTIRGMWIDQLVIISTIQIQAEVLCVSFCYWQESAATFTNGINKLLQPQKWMGCNYSSMPLKYLKDNLDKQPQKVRNGLHNLLPIKHNGC